MFWRQRGIIDVARTGEDCRESTSHRDTNRPMAAWIELHAPAVAISISTIALLISAFSLSLTWRRDRKAEEATYPLVELHIAPHPIEPSIHAVTIAITNRMDHHIYVQNISIHRPKAAAFVAHHEERGSHEPPTIFRVSFGVQN
jgi:hypothetical protein